MVVKECVSWLCCTSHTTVSVERLTSCCLNIKVGDLVTAFSYKDLKCFKQLFSLFPASFFFFRFM